MSQCCCCRCFASSVAWRQQALFIKCPWPVCTWEKTLVLKRPYSFSVQSGAVEWGVLVCIFSLLCGFDIDSKPKLSLYSVTLTIVLSFYHSIYAILWNSYKDFSTSFGCPCTLKDVESFDGWLLPWKYCIWPDFPLIAVTFVQCKLSPASAKDLQWILFFCEQATDV